MKHKHSYQGMNPTGDTTQVAVRLIQPLSGEGLVGRKGQRAWGIFDGDGKLIDIDLRHEIMVPSYPNYAKVVSVEWMKP